VVEDDPILGRSLSISLELEGYKITWCKDLRSAKATVAERGFDLTVLDMNLPDGSGLDLCTSLRKSGVETPIIFLTAKVDEESVVAGFNAGANDYVKKPFSNRELLVRIKAHLNGPLNREAQLKFGSLTLMPAKRQAFSDQTEIELNRREFDVLSILMRHPEAVVTRDALLSSLDKEGEIFDRTIDSHVSHIRSKLKKSNVESVQITSVYGVGYRLEKK
jgi:two-component system OmpR family response regulator